MGLQLPVKEGEGLGVLVALGVPVAVLVPVGVPVLVGLRVGVAVPVAVHVEVEVGVPPQALGATSGGRPPARFVSCSSKSEAGCRPAVPKPS